ncbi:MAG: cation diffusion facilitator family transporter [SAR324 cluster bacterium]|nr:cation diffusion facilitator family transporter [SAR324 cluster bacterium]
MKRRVYKSPTGFTAYLVSKFVKEPAEIEDPDIRASYGYLGGWVSCIVNFLLSLFKLALGLTINSQALIADAIHSASDMFSSVIVILGFKWAKIPRDKEHPFGHANAELVASLVMAILLIVGGFELFRVNALDLYAKDFHDVNPTYGLIAAVAATILAKEWLSAFSMGLARAIGSSALEADAWHHRIDSITTGLVVVALVGNTQGLFWLDSAMGVIVSLVVMWSGVEIAQESISPLLGEMVDEETLWEIRAISLETDERIGNVHDIMVHRYGHCHFVTLHMEVLGDLTPVQMHDIAADVGTRVGVRFNGECSVHVDPVDFDAPYYKQVAAILEDLMGESNEIIDFHDLQFRPHEAGEIVHWEFSIDSTFREEDFPKLKSQILEKLEPKLPEYQLKFSLEPGYNIVKRH